MYGRPWVRLWSATALGVASVAACADSRSRDSSAVPAGPGVCFNVEVPNLVAPVRGCPQSGDRTATRRGLHRRERLAVSKLGSLRNPAETLGGDAGSDRAKDAGTSMRRGARQPPRRAAPQGKSRSFIGLIATRSVGSRRRLGICWRLGRRGGAPSFTRAGESGKLFDGLLLLVVAVAESRWVAGGS